MHVSVCATMRKPTHQEIFQFSSVAQSCPTLCESRSLSKFMSIESVMPSNHLILCHPLLLLPSIFPSISIFSNESVLHIKWPKYWSFSFNISPSKEHPGLISFRMDWLDLLAETKLHSSYSRNKRKFHLPWMFY